MSNTRLIFITILLVFLFQGCSSLEESDQKNLRQVFNNTNEQGWNSFNCAHIMADGSCAHQIGNNEFGLSDGDQDDISDSELWDETNCAHVMADGSCAHEL